MEFFLQQIMTGLSIGSILLLIALGLAIIYGSMGVINMAHGEFVMLGAYGAWAMNAFFGVGLLPSLIVVFLGVGALGWLVERGVIRFLYRRTLDTILATWGLGVMLQQMIRLSAGGELRYVEMPSVLTGTVGILGVDVPGYRVFIFVFVAALFAVTWYLMFRTTFGTKLRAVVQDRSVASCFGIDADKVYSLTFAYGAGLAGLAGALVAPLKSVSPEMGTTYVVDAFFVVVLGGVQSLFGTVASALMLGELTGGLAYLWNDTIAKALVLLAIIVLIRFRPQGLFVSRIRS
ncbi:MAG: urea ABC transporter permease subunit UrtB [Alphaproteobacteria bacterium]|jgi:urea transport system permease protein|uniref:urea ABC transporter permease subunit UrtB n=1 Tax=Pacificispira sp. TaxID=2888761 RepID=UPI001B1F44B5|nr:urea ABC transporter permease subunit UrtB [Alphaproteobacteria bacterium]MBO6864459.1 urea ABC transporter permease subunit UrtB [Alphaproteobacteria bacterium]MEC9265983.1 urea ABC transporter permease subunit UrtB [Pseudomonadota bacterium]